MKYILILSLIACNSLVAQDTLVYHVIKIGANGKIIPWNADDPGKSYDDILKRVWTFWKNLQIDSNGQPYYMNHQVWSPEHDRRGLGGDQLMMAMSSWDLYHNYTGDTALINNMRYMADYYLGHSLSPANSKWPNLPYPYNTNVESGICDGDMILGKDILQPDKAGSFGFELVHLYKKTGDVKYLNAAVNIANTLADKAREGDEDHSPWPFKVNAITGDTGVLVNDEGWYEGMDKDVKKLKDLKKSTYTTFWCSTLGLFDELIALKKGNTSAYRKAYNATLAWMKKYPMKNNKWGPFFEDVPRWSDTQINAITFAMYLLQHPSVDVNWKEDVKGIIGWVYRQLGNDSYKKYGVTVINEQTAYAVPGNSHTARQGSVDLMYAEATGDTSAKDNAIRQLNWATYMVDSDGKNFYPTNAIWMTDGYGDYVRHYLRAMAAAPELAPAKDVLLSSSSIVQKISYGEKEISYTTFDKHATERFKLNKKPSSISGAAKWTWKALPQGGVLTLQHTRTRNVSIVK